jgi:hypothetical protein
MEDAPVIFRCNPLIARGLHAQRTCMAASFWASCARIRAILPPRPPKRPQGSFDSSAASLSSAAVALDCVPSVLVYVVSSSSDESESDPSACKSIMHTLADVPRACSPCRYAKATLVSLLKQHHGVRR